MKKVALLLTLLAFTWAQADTPGEVSHFIESKKGPDKLHLCEDGYFFNEHYLLVVDGASDKSGRLYDGHTGGWHCKEAVLSVFRRLRGEESAEEILSLINTELGQVYEKFGVDPVEEPLYRFSSVLVWYSFEQNCLYAVGDCKARIDGKLFNAEEKLVDRLNSEFRVRVLEELKATSGTPSADLGREYILPLLREQSRYQNNLEAPEALQYWVVDGTPIPSEKIKRKQLNSPPRTIELSSDGYAEFPKDSTIEAYEALLAELLAEDPTLTQRVKSTKGLKKGQVSFDDRTVLIYKR